MTALSADFTTIALLQALAGLNMNEPLEHRSILDMTFSENERKTLLAWAGSSEEDNVLPFAAVARRAEINPGSVRRFVRALARKGALEFCRMSWNDEGPCGAGYKPTAAGYTALAALSIPS
jgi:hypothetical protein